MTHGGSSLREVQDLLAVLAVGKRVGEAGTAFGEGAAAMAETARSVVTVECDLERGGQSWIPSASGCQGTRSCGDRGVDHAVHVGAADRPVLLKLRGYEGGVWSWLVAVAAAGLVLLGGSDEYGLA